MRIPKFFRMPAFAAACFVFPTDAPADVRISEFMADNDSFLADADGDYEDWIEIHNAGPGAVNLAGYTLSDDAADPGKWAFPAVALPGGGYLLVFASGKDRAQAGAELHANFKLDRSDDYLGLFPPGGGAALTEFAPFFPPQRKNLTYGEGYAGAVTETDLTPPAQVAGTTYARAKITGAGAVSADGSLNSFDDSLGDPGHQQYQWYDYSAQLALIPAGHTVVSAVLQRAGEARLVAGASGLSCVDSRIGVFAAPSVNMGAAAIAESADGTDLIDFYAANDPVSSVLARVGESESFRWDITPLASAWHSDPADPLRGQFVLVNEKQPCWIAWDQNAAGPALTVLSTDAPTTELAQGYLFAPTPGAANTGVDPAGPLLSDVTKNPPPPDAGADLLITALQHTPVEAATMYFRVNYAAEQMVPMADDGTGGDAVAGDGIWSAAIPGSALQAGQMLRWRIEAADAAGDTTEVPDYYDPANAPQYYGTVPADPAIATNLPLLHWFIQNPSAAATTAGTRCSLYFLGEFYDNIEINIHGQSTRGAAFAKKSHNLDFNRGERFRWSPDAPRVKDINFMTNFADKTKMRHPLCYELHREAGSPAHFAFTMRVQQNGAFYGLMDFIEDADDVYLDRAGLNPDGALYKMYNNMANPATNAAAGAEKKNRREENNADLQAFLDGMHQANAADRKAFFFDNLDIPRMISFMAATSVSSNHDVHSKNYYIYRDTGRTNEWTLLPWDLDLSMGRRWTSTNNYFDDLVMVDHPIRNATGQNLVAKLYAISEFNEMAKRRIRSLNDRFLQRVEDEPDPAQRWMERRMDENLALLGDDLILDYNKWVLGSATGHGPWKLTVDAVNGDSPFRDHTPAQEVQRVKDEYLTGRRAFVYSHGDTVAAQDAADPPPLSIAAAEVSPASGNQDEEFIEIANANAVAVDISDWRLAEAVEFTFRPGTVIPPNTSLFVSPDVNAFRARAASPTGGESRFVQGGYQGHLSNLGETIRLIDAGGTERAAFSTPAEPTDLQRFLVVSEFCYHPVNGAAEFIELANMSADLTLDLGGVYFSQGIAFTFPGGTQLAPGERTLVVRDLAAFEAEHGSGLPVAGAFAGGSALDNAGETIKLEDAIGQTIREFTYDDADPWPALADTQGFSLVLRFPEQIPDHNDPANWRISALPGGAPGAADTARFSGDPEADADGDGFSALAEHGLGTSDGDPGDAAGALVFGFDGGRTLTLLRSAVADDTEVAIELSASLQDGSWQPLDAAQRIESEPDPSGRWREVWALPAEFGEAAFARLKVVWR